MNISEKHDRQHYFGVLITPQKHHFTKTDSLMVVEGTEMKDDDVGKYLCQYLEGERYGGGDEINFYGLIEIQVSRLFSQTEIGPLTSGTPSGSCY